MFLIKESTFPLIDAIASERNENEQKKMYHMKSEHVQMHARLCSAYCFRAQRSQSYNENDYSVYRVYENLKCEKRKLNKSI